MPLPDIRYLRTYLRTSYMGSILPKVQPRGCTQPNSYKETTPSKEFEVGRLRPERNEMLIVNEKWIDRLDYNQSDELDIPVVKTFMLDSKFLESMLSNQTTTQLVLMYLTEFHGPNAAEFARDKTAHQYYATRMLKAKAGVNDPTSRFVLNRNGSGARLLLN